VTIETGGSDSITGVFLSHEARMLCKVDSLANKSQFREFLVNYDISWVLMENISKGEVVPVHTVKAYRGSGDIAPHS
jgi:hypothetical protein